MHVISISKPRSILEAELLQRHHRLRAEVFSDRLGWDVDVVDGCEKDAFDQEGPAYILAIATTGEVAGCARLLPAIGPTMIADVFGSLLPDGRLNAHPAMVESSRFCVDTRLSGGRGTGSLHEATLSMFAGIIEWSIENGFTEIVTVTDLRFERILGRVERIDDAEVGPEPPGDRSREAPPEPAASTADEPGLVHPGGAVAQLRRRHRAVRRRGRGACLDAVRHREGHRRRQRERHLDRADRHPARRPVAPAARRRLGGSRARRARHPGETREVLHAGSR